VSAHYRKPDLEVLFGNAVAEIAGQVDDEDFDADYGFQSEWDDEEGNEEDFVTQGYHCWAHRRCDLLADSVGTNLKVNSIRALPCCFCSRTS
jgi:hypothetical protein